MPGVSSAQDCSLICQLMWHLLAMMSGVLSAHDYSNGVSADLFAIEPDVSAAQDYSFVCQLLSLLLAMIPGVTIAQDYSTGVSADVLSACKNGWYDNCLILLNWCVS